MENIICFLLGLAVGIFGAGMANAAKRGDRMINIDDVSWEDKEENDD